MTTPCSVTGDNNIADGAIKWHNSESIELGVRRSVDLRFILHLTILILT